MHVMTGLIGIYAIWSILQTLFQCLPLAAHWRFIISPHPRDKCIPVRAHLLSLAVPNVILDWALLFFPMPIIWNLKMSLTHKIQVLIAMGTGAM